MKNDLTHFEKAILSSINNLHNTKYTYKNLMEWDSRKDYMEKNIQDGEILYNVLGVYVAIKP